MLTNILALLKYVFPWNMLEASIHRKNSIMIVLQSHLLEVLSVMTYNVVSILFKKVKMGMFISRQFAQLRLLILA